MDVCDDDGMMCGCGHVSISTHLFHADWLEVYLKLSTQSLWSSIVDEIAWHYRYKLA